MKPPNDDGALSHAPVAEPQALQRYSECPHVATHVEFCAPGFVHYSRVICDRCGRFLDWLPRPSNAVRRRMIARRLALLGRSSELNPWEHRFVKDVSEKRKLSPRQEQKVDEIWSAHQQELEL
jgi:hypothetical protein